MIFDANSGSVLEENTRFEDLPLAAYQGGTLYFEHQDWLGTERLLTNSQGATAGSYSSMPFGDESGGLLHPEAPRLGAASRERRQCDAAALPSQP